MAWPTDRKPTDALTAEFVPQIWSARVINHVRSNLVALQVCDTTWKEVLSKGDKVWIPVMTTLAASDVDVTSAAVLTAASRAFGTTAEYIEILYWKENPVMIDDSSAAQTHVGGLLDKAADNTAYGLEKAIDTTINTLFQSLTNTWLGTDGQTFTDDIFISLIEGLDEADVPRKDRSLVVDPSTIADIYKIDKFMTFDYSKSPFATEGYVGRVNAYQTPVFITNNLSAGTATTGAYAALLHKEAIAVVLQSEIKVEKWREPSRHSDVINVSCFYGADVLRSTFGAQFYTRKK